MARGAMKAQWTHTANIVAMLHNVNCTSESALKSPLEFMPESLRPKLPPPERISWAEFKQAFTAATGMKPPAKS